MLIKYMYYKRHNFFILYLGSSRVSIVTGLPTSCKQCYSAIVSCGGNVYRYKLNKSQSDLYVYKIYLPPQLTTLPTIPT